MPPFCCHYVYVNSTSHAVCTFCYHCQANLAILSWLPSDLLLELHMQMLNPGLSVPFHFCVASPSLRSANLHASCCRQCHT